MTWKQVFTSSIGQKITMSLTGIFLILFLIVHVSVNACVWFNDGGEIFNRAANFLGANAVPRVIEIGFISIFHSAYCSGLCFRSREQNKTQCSLTQLIMVIAEAGGTAAVWVYWVH